MARIFENQNSGRRMIRLSPDDVLMVVSQYQQQLYDLRRIVEDGEQSQNPDHVYDKLKECEFYLPEDM